MRPDDDTHDEGESSCLVVQLTNQLTELMKQKSTLARDNDKLVRENDKLLELLDYMISNDGKENTDRHMDNAQNEEEGAQMKTECELMTVLSNATFVHEDQAFEDASCVNSLIDQNQKE